MGNLRISMYHSILCASFQYLHVAERPSNCLENDFAFFRKLSFRGRKRVVRELQFLYKIIWKAQPQ